RAGLAQRAVRLAAAELGRLGVGAATVVGAEAVAARAAFEAVREHALDDLAPVERFPGFAGALAATLAELRLGGVAADALSKIGAPARDVAALARRFDERLHDGKIADRAAMLEIATRALGRDADELVRRMPMVLPDVTIDGPVERAFIHALTRESPAVLVTVAAGADAPLQALRSLGAPEADVDRRDDAGDLPRARQ